MRPKTRALKRYIPKPPAHRSPVLTSTRWDGSDYVLSSPVPDLSLDYNPYARMLSSPLRIDRATRLVSVPRNIMMKYSLVQHPETGDKWYVPIPDTETRTGAGSGYGPNKKSFTKTLTSKKFGLVASMELLNNTYNMTVLDSVNWNEGNWWIIEGLYLETLMNEIECIEKQTDITSNALVILLTDGPARLKIDESVTYINVSGLTAEHPTYKDLLVKLQKLSADEKVVIQSRHSKFIDTFIRFVTYLE